MDHRIRGKANRSNGELFEKMITRSSDAYWKQGIACVEKTPEPMRPIKALNRNKGQFVAIYSKQAQPDFKGVLCDGRCILFDAKYTSKDRIQQSAVTEKQIETFDRYEEMDALCFVVVCIQYEQFYRVPWKDWKNMKALFGHKHITLEELEKYRVPYKNGMICYLEGVEIEEQDS